MLDGLAQHDGEQKAVHIRVAQVDGAIFRTWPSPVAAWPPRLRQGNGRWCKTTPFGFCAQTPCARLPVPVAGVASMDALWQFVNVPEGARLLVLAWLLECLRPDGVFPVLELLARQAAPRAPRNAICATC